MYYFHPLNQTLRLTRRYAAVFCPNEKETLKQLKQIDPFIFYGYPSAGTVRSLLTKRAKVREEAIDDDGNKSVAIIPLSTNLIVEQRFGQEGLLSVEDLVHNVRKHTRTYTSIVLSQLCHRRPLPSYRSFFVSLNRVEFRQCTFTSVTKTSQTAHYTILTIA